MAHFSDGRSTEQVGGGSDRTDIAMEKKHRLSRFLEALRADDRFYDYLSFPFVLRAIEHWTGKNRVKDDPQFIERINHDQTALYVFRKIVQVNRLVTEASVPFPLEEILERRRWNEASEMETRSSSGVEKKDNEHVPPPPPPSIGRGTGSWIRLVAQVAIQVAILGFLIRFYTTDVSGFPGALKTPF